MIRSRYGIHGFLSGVLVLLFAGALPALAAPKAELWGKWLAHAPASAVRVDHAAWGKFLAVYLIRGSDGINRFAYGKVTGGDRKILEEYIARLASAPVRRLNRKEQLAFWINLYNALTVRVILDHYPTGSILKISISPGWFSVGPWGKKLIEIEGEKLSLDDIEHRILRPIWKDPRIHYAVNCASIGCPNLAAKPYLAESADAMLTEGAQAYVNHPRGARIAEGGLLVSSIYHWYKSDFGGDDAGVIRHLKKYAAPALRRRLGKIEEIADHGYDWALNEAGPPAN
ncbi:MAG: DUF547 domain-containing protein [bacterium]|nr:DUF547 domain-containing protein [bacterium]